MISHLVVSIALVVSTSLLWARIRRERVEARSWEGFEGTPPEDIHPLIQFLPSSYTSAGRKLLPWYLVSAAASFIAVGSLILGVV
jgi:hypothetical protein